MTTAPRATLAKLVVPLLACAAISALFYFGGDNYQAFGLEAVDTTRRALKYVLGVAAFMSLAVLAQRVIRYIVFDGLVARATGVPVPKLLSQISGLLIFMVAASACAGIVFNQDLTVLWAASGVAGLVLGMALRELLQDVFAGIALNIDRAARIGDFIQIHKSGDARITGQLVEISWRTTRIRDILGDIVVFPNSKFSSFTLTNFSKPEPVSVRSVSVTLDVRVAPEQAMRILQAAALEAMIKLAGTATAAPWVEVKSVSLDGVEYAIFFKAEWKHLRPAQPAILQNALVHLRHAGLEPASQRANAQGATGADAAVPGAARVAAVLGVRTPFRALAEPARAALAELGRMRVEAPDRVVAQSGEAASSLFVVLEGLLTAETARRVAGRAPLNGMLRPGDIFDATAALLGEAHGSTVRTRTPVLLCEIGSGALQEVFSRYPASLEQVGRSLALAHAPAGAGMEEDHLVGILTQMRHLFPPAPARMATLPAARLH